MRLEFVGACIIFIAATLALVALVTSGVDAGLVGFVLSYALNTTSSLVNFYSCVLIAVISLIYQNWLVRSVSEVEQNIVSVERILHYVKLTPEAPAEISGAIPVEWPKEGEVEFK